MLGIIVTVFSLSAGVLVPFLVKAYYEKTIRFNNLNGLMKAVVGYENFSTDIKCYDLNGNLYPEEMPIERLIDLFSVKEVEGVFIHTVTGKTYVKANSAGEKIRLSLW